MAAPADLVGWHAFDHFVADGRTFHVFVVVGERVPATALRELRRVLRSLS